MIASKEASIDKEIEDLTNKIEDLKVGKVDLVDEHFKARDKAAEPTILEKAFSKICDGIDTFIEWNEKRKAAKSLKKQLEAPRSFTRSARRSATTRSFLKSKTPRRKSRS